jgi:hypothetical protein
MRLCAASCAVDTVPPVRRTTSPARSLSCPKTSSWPKSVKNYFQSRAGSGVQSSLAGTCSLTASHPCPDLCMANCQSRSDR